MQGKKPHPTRFKKSFIAVAVMLGISGGVAGEAQYERNQRAQRAADLAAQTAPTPAPASMSFNRAANEGTDVTGSVCDISDETAQVCSLNDNMSANPAPQPPGR